MPKARFYTVRLLPAKRWWLAACVLLAVGMGWWLAIPASPIAVQADPGSPPGAQLGAAAPDFTLQGIDGQSVNLAGLQGRPVILYFWAGWCSYCRSEMPSLEQAFAAHQNEGLVVLGINIMERPDAVREHGIDMRLSFPLLLDSDAEVARLYHVRATPTYYFIDRAGNLTGRIIGQARPPAFRSHLSEILRSQPPSEPDRR